MLKTTGKQCRLLILKASTPNQLYNFILIMGKLLNQLKDYFENTPKEVLEKEAKEWEYPNEIGPDVLEYAKIVRDTNN